MSCGCEPPNSPSGGISPTENPPTLPSVGQHQALKDTCPPNGDWVEPQCGNGQEIGASTSAGARLPASLTDARCANEGEGLTLLARAGNILSRFTGSGFLQIRAGKAFLVPHVPVSVRQLWHRYFRRGNDVQPSLGDPHPFEYQIIGDKNGGLYAIQGFGQERTVHLWNPVAGHWESVAPKDFPLEVARRLEQREELELVGFNPVCSTGNFAETRPLMALGGRVGVVYIERCPAPKVAGECEPCPDTAFTYKTRILPFPESSECDETHSEQFKLVCTREGVEWVPDTLTPPGTSLGTSFLGQ